MMTARRGDRLEALANEFAGSCPFVAGDIGDASVRERVINEAVERWRAVDT